MFRQFFDAASSTLTYLLADEASHEAVLIDPVDTEIATYLAVLKTHHLTLKYALETHVHADHITASGQLRQLLGAKTAVSLQCGAITADLQLQHQDTIRFGAQTIQVIATPGHTLGSLCFYVKNQLFTGDTLLINGCGRTDFQGGDAGQLYDSVTQQIFTLPDETLIYPAHDYNCKRVSNVAQEKNSNARFTQQTRESFIHMMQHLNLAKPKLIDLAVPANRMCGVPEAQLPQG